MKIILYNNLIETNSEVHHNANTNNTLVHTANFK